MAANDTVWTVTAEAFDSLLRSLDADREQAGRIYENLRRKLVEFFEARGSHTPEDHTDETFDRVMRRIAGGETIHNPAGYCHGVAKFVWMEASRNRAKAPVELDENSLVELNSISPDLENSRERVEQELECLDSCLSRLAEETRKFIFDYYREENGLKIEQRKLLAATLNTTLNALRLRASRLRRELARCTDACVTRSIKSGGVK